MANDTDENEPDTPRDRLRIGERPEGIPGVNNPPVSKPDAAEGSPDREP